MPRTLLAVLGVLLAWAGCDGPGPSGPHSAEDMADQAGPPADHGGQAGDLAGSPGWWRPRAGMSWDWQLQTPVNLGAAVEVYDIDALDNDKSVMDALHNKGRKVICYVDVGSREGVRPDAKAFPQVVIGATYKGFPDENWLDIRRIDLLGPIMAARLNQAQSKGCDGIEPDNMDGYDTKAHESSGFPLTYDDQLKYNRWIAAQAHMRGMAVGLKNDVPQARDLLGDVDFHVSEQAFQYKEYDLLVPFIMAGKPVFETEYNLALAQFCPDANRLNFSSIRKNVKLDAYREACR